MASPPKKKQKTKRGAQTQDDAERAARRSARATALSVAATAASTAAELPEWTYGASLVYQIVRFIEEKTRVRFFLTQDPETLVEARIVGMDALFNLTLKGVRIFVKQ